MKKKIARALAGLPTGGTKGRPDERWYWAGPLLLDREASLTWLQMRDALGNGLEKGADLGLANGMRDLLTDPRQLGQRPDDLEQVLAMLALAGPAICAFRALRRMVSGRSVPSETRRAAFHVARGFQTLFNQSDATLVVQYEHRRET